MKISTFSIVVGTKACNAHCPFCVSRMTGFDEVQGRLPTALSVNFKAACRLAERANTTTVLFTGKGEPTLYPEQITQYLRVLEPWGFPFIEMQTNGLTIGRLASTGLTAGGIDEATLRKWRELGLTTIALSTVGFMAEHNREVYHPDYPDLETTVRYLRDLGFTIRLCVMMTRGYVDSPAKVAEVVDWCRTNKVAQLTVRPIRKPDNAAESRTMTYVERRGLTDEEVTAVNDWVQGGRKPIMIMSHGALVYDVDGQNVCLTDCLTVPDEPDTIRTLIYYPSGRLAYLWQYKGAVLLGPTEIEDEN